MSRAAQAVGYVVIGVVLWQVSVAGWCALQNRR